MQIMPTRSASEFAGIACAFLALVLLPVFVSAEQQTAELDITPVVVDEKAMARDILKYEITLVNTSEYKLNLYPTVNDIDPEEGKENFVRAQNADERTASLANWIELSRGVIELGPGEEKKVPFVVRVSLNATPGSYHARVAFHNGGTRSGAEASPALGATTVNIEVRADIKEEMQLNKFSTDNVYLAGDDVLFSYNLENIGNQDLRPTGEIRIYNRKGEEVASLGVNSDGKIVGPNQSSQMATVWSAVDGLGRFKAFLTVNFGENQTASVQDTIYFWIIPWKQLLILFIGSLLLMVFLALYFHRWFERRHYARLAPAGGPLLDHQSEEYGLPGVSAVQAVGGAVLSFVLSVAGGAISLVAGGARVAGSVGRMRRREDIESAPTQPQPVPQSPALTANSQKQRSLREALGPVEDWRATRQAPEQEAQGHTINLKNLRNGAEQTPTYGHVIDLKKHK
jgi:hypothetical protein